MKYIVAVSGGIDSVVLLHMMTHDTRWSADELIVAHCDHGIRDDSADDAALVKGLATTYGLNYESIQLQLGPDASEDVARTARYEFLTRLKDKHSADAIITAHHQDDVIETMLINLIRGTGWRGLCSLCEHDGIKRPLLTMSKAEIAGYAIRHELEWHDDSTNDDPRYLRNYLRQTIMRSLLPAERNSLLHLYEQQVELASHIDEERRRVMESVRSECGLQRYWLIMAGESVAGELICAIGGQRFETRSLKRLWHFACTARVGKQTVEDGIVFRATASELIVSPPHI